MRTTSTFDADLHLGEKIRQVYLCTTFQPPNQSSVQKTFKTRYKKQKQKT